jgi:hypothetical protein
MTSNKDDLQPGVERIRELRQLREDPRYPYFEGETCEKNQENRKLERMLKIMRASTRKDLEACDPNNEAKIKELTNQMDAFPLTEFSHLFRYNLNCYEMGMGDDLKCIKKLILKLKERSKMQLSRISDIVFSYYVQIAAERPGANYPNGNRFIGIFDHVEKNISATIDNPDDADSYYCMTEEEGGKAFKRLLNRGAKILQKHSGFIEEHAELFSEFLSEIAVLMEEEEKKCREAARTAIERLQRIPKPEKIDLGKGVVLAYDDHSGETRGGRDHVLSCGFSAVLVLVVAAYLSKYGCQSHNGETSTFSTPVIAPSLSLECKGRITPIESSAQKITPAQAQAKLQRKRSNSDLDFICYKTANEETCYQFPNYCTVLISPEF